MADNVTVGGINYSTDDITTLNGGAIAAGTAQTQRMKVQYGDDGTARDVSDNYPLPIKRAADAASITSVAASTTSVTVLAANANRRGLLLHNLSSSDTCYIRLGGGTATNALGGHSFDLSPSYVYEDANGFTGAITAVWSSTNGGLNVTEMT